MIRNHLSLLRLNRAYKAGLWTDDLHEQVWSHWESSPSNLSLMLLIKVQHSLRGFSSTNAEQLIEQAYNRCESLNASSQLRLAALAFEHGLDFNSAITVNASLTAYPLLAEQLYQADNGDSTIGKVESIDSALKHLAKAFTARLVEWDDYARYLRSKSIAVVGNAGTGLGENQGQQIDCADAVIRFNQINTQPQFTTDYGSKTSLWVISPGFKPDPASMPAKTLIISGVSPFHKPTQYWQRLARLPIERVLTFPPRVWYRLVRELDAPPTAGLLTLASLKESLDDCTKVQVAGFSIEHNPANANHYGDSGKRSTRHNWPGEAAVAQKLIASLHNATPTDFNTACANAQAASQKSS